MPAPITIVIPTLNAAHALQRSLPPLVEGITEGLVQTVLFADGGSNDAIQEIAEASGAEISKSAPGRGTQLRSACETVTSDWILILHADTVLPVDWTSHIKRALTMPDRAHVFHLSFDASGFWPHFVAGWANKRTRVFGLPYGDQTLLISRRLYKAAGGYPEVPLMEDVAIARALRGKIHLMDASVVTSADKYIRDGWIKRGFKNLSLLLRYKLGADPRKLAKAYRSTTKEL